MGAWIGRIIGDIGGPTSRRARLQRLETCDGHDQAEMRGGKGNGYLGLKLVVIASLQISQIDNFQGKEACR